MRVRRFMAAGAAVLLCLVLAGLIGCQEQQRPVFRIGVALYSQEDTFISTVAQKMDKLAKEEEQKRGVKINMTLADGERSQSVQNEQVDRFLSQGYDIICVNIVDRTAAAVIVDKAQRADVPVIFFNREPVREDLDRWEHAYYVGSQAIEAGRMQGRLVLNAWQEDRAAIDRNGDGVLQYVMLEGEPGHQDTLLRTEYSVKTLQSSGVSLERLGNYTADWQRGKAGVKMEQWLEELDGRIEAVLANNDDMALGAIDACQTAGLAPEELPLVVGVDATDEAVEAVAQGLMWGTVRNDAQGQARQMMETACALLYHKPLEDAVDLVDEHYIWLKYSPVDQAAAAAETRS